MRARENFFTAESLAKVEAIFDQNGAGTLAGPFFQLAIMAVTVSPDDWKAVFVIGLKQHELVKGVALPPSVHDAAAELVRKSKLEIVRQRYTKEDEDGT